MLREKSMAPDSNQNFGVPIWSETCCSPLSLSIQFWHWPGRDSCARKWDYVHFLPKGKILLGQARHWGLQCLSQPLHLLLGAFEQTNVNSRSNITRRKQTSISALYVYTTLWLNFWGYLQLCLPPKKQLTGSACDMVNAMLMRVWVHFLPTNWTVVVKLPVTSHVVQ